MGAPHHILRVAQVHPGRAVPRGRTLSPVRRSRIRPGLCTCVRSQGMSPHAGARQGRGPQDRATEAPILSLVGWDQYTWYHAIAPRMFGDYQDFELQAVLKIPKVSIGDFVS